MYGHIIPVVFVLQALKACFETKNIPKLQETLSQMSKEDASYHMNRCIAAGLWVSDAKAAGNVHVGGMGG